MSRLLGVGTTPIRAPSPTPIAGGAGGTAVGTYKSEATPPGHTHLDEEAPVMESCDLVEWLAWNGASRVERGQDPSSLWHSSTMVWNRDSGTKISLSRTPLRSGHRQIRTPRGSDLHVVEAGILQCLGRVAKQLVGMRHVAMPDSADCLLINLKRVTKLLLHLSCGRERERGLVDYSVRNGLKSGGKFSEGRVIRHLADYSASRVNKKTYRQCQPC